MGIKEGRKKKGKRKEETRGQAAKLRGIGNNPATRRYRERVPPSPLLVGLHYRSGNENRRIQLFPRKKISMKKEKKKKEKLAVDNRATLHSSTRRRLRREKGGGGGLAGQSW